MNHFLIVANADRDKKLLVTYDLKERLEERGAEVDLHITKACPDGSYTSLINIKEGVECVLVLGGDGTFIAAARDIAEREIPMLGVNLGTLGFLTDIEVSQLDTAIDSLMNGRYEIEERMLLCGKAFHKNGILKGETRALNDVVLHTSGGIRMSDYTLFVNDSELSDFRADGMIVCTPTGSTAYSMSAGGPIVEPTARMMAVTPICPHTLNTRSIVLSEQSEICIRVNNSGSEVSFDGHNSLPLDEGDYVVVRPSRKVTKIVRIEKGSFLAVLSTKFQS